MVMARWLTASCPPFLHFILNLSFFLIFIQIASPPYLKCSPTHFFFFFFLLDEPELEFDEDGTELSASKEGEFDHLFCVIDFINKKKKEGSKEMKKIVKLISYEGQQ